MIHSPKGVRELTYYSTFHSCSVFLWSDMINILFFEENSFKQRLKRIDFSCFLLQEESSK